jgi:hypothetical protein
MSVPPPDLRATLKLMHAGAIRLAMRLILCLALSISLPFVTEARASVSVAISWESLLGSSVAAVCVTPAESQSIWEEGRIVTYTRVHVDRPVAGSLPTSSDPWIRTLGGIVGNVGQRVEGEAVLSIGRPSLIFVRPGPGGTFRVTERSQGQYAIVSAGSGSTHILRASSAGAILKPMAAPTSAGARLASDVLGDRAVEDAVSEIASEWGHTHAPQ